MAQLVISLFQQNYHTGNFERNTDQIISAIRQAREDGSDLVVFPELSICGYPPRDFLEFEDFIEQGLQSVSRIAEACVGIAAIVGAPTRNPVIEGKDLYNSALLLQDGQIKAIRNKSLLPNYDIFDEYRYFEPNRNFELVEVKGVKIALTICEDLWNINENPMYIHNPMDELIRFGPDLMINIAASPYSSDQIRRRREVMQDNARKYRLPLIYCNLTGAQTQLIFDGGSMLIEADGTVLSQLAHFKEDHVQCRVSTGTPATIEQLSIRTAKPEWPVVEEIHQALVLGIREYFTKQRLGQAVLGLSGGIDSALVLVLAVEALGPEKVRAVLLPSRYSSDHSVTDSIDLAQRLGVAYDIIPIEPTFQALEKTLKPVFNSLPEDLTEENMQSRSRGVILMAICNKFGSILLNTSNKSELAVGYGTLYGDMCGGLSVIGDLYKTEVYHLAKHINREQEIIPEHIITKAPSAELRPDQKDSDSLPDYTLLDRILYAYIEERKSPLSIITECGDEATVRKVLKLVNSNEWKRLQAPPVLRVSNKAFGSGRRVPIVARYLI